MAAVLKEKGSTDDHVTKHHQDTALLAGIVPPLLSESKLARSELDWLF